MFYCTYKILVDMQATTKIYFQKTKARRTKDDLCPVKLCVTHNRVQKYYSISKKINNHKWLFLSLDDIEKVTCESPRGKYRDIAFEYKRIVGDAENVIKGINAFSFNQFEEKFFSKPTSWDNVFIAFIDHIKTLKSEGRFGYASSFESTLRAVKEFHENKKFEFKSRQKVETRINEYLSGRPLNFVDINSKWLKNFEMWLHKEGKSKSTIGIYTRNIRVLFNIALRVHKINAEYPFDNYEPKTASGRKIALPANQISLIANYKTEDPQEGFYRDLFMFSFLGNGMNLSDIARLKYSNIIDNEIEFVRQKTKNKKADEDKIHVPLTSTMSKIIDRYGNKAVGYDSYIFPILKNDSSEEKKYAEVKQLVKQVNKYVGRIASVVGIKEKVSSYVARHSWATIAKNSGTSTEFISEALGHSSVTVTKRYLDSFDKATREKHSQKMEDAIFNQKAI